MRKRKPGQPHKGWKAAARKYKMADIHRFEGSSAVYHCHYDEGSKCLTIRFNTSDKEHKFNDVPKEIYEGLKAAQSPGKFFHQNVRNKFKSE